jgi:hypothetical protein
MTEISQNAREAAKSLCTGFPHVSCFDCEDSLACAIAAAEQRGAVAERERAALPERPCADLTDILGRMCFQCINIADLLRVNGWEIKKRAEDEQAAVVLFTLNHWLADKENWRDNADQDLQEIAQTIRTGTKP